MSYLGGRTIYIDSNGYEHFDYERDYEPKPITNADRIRAMSDAELAEFLNSLLGGCDFEGCPAYIDCHSLNSEMCVGHLNEWLRQEAKTE